MHPGMYRREVSSVQAYTHTHTHTHPTLQVVATLRQAALEAEAALEAQALESQAALEAQALESQAALEAAATQHAALEDMLQGLQERIVELEVCVIVRCMCVYPVCVHVGLL